MTDETFHSSSITNDIDEYLARTRQRLIDFHQRYYENWYRRYHTIQIENLMRMDRERGELQSIYAWPDRFRVVSGSLER